MKITAKSSHLDKPGQCNQYILRHSASEVHMTVERCKESKRSYHQQLGITNGASSCLCPFQDRQKCTALKQGLTYWHQPLSQLPACHETLHTPGKEHTSTRMTSSKG